MLDVCANETATLGPVYIHPNAYTPVLFRALFAQGIVQGYSPERYIL